MTISYQVFVQMRVWGFSTGSAMAGKSEVLKGGFVLRVCFCHQPSSKNSDFTTGGFDPPKLHHRKLVLKDHEIERYPRVGRPVFICHDVESIGQKVGVAIDHDRIVLMRA